MKNKRTLSRKSIALLVILIIAGSLRLYRLNERGLILFDEAHYLLEARWFLSLLSCLPGLSRWTEWALGVKKFNFMLITPSCVAKPGFGLLLASFSLIVGLRDYTSLLFSAITSLFIILLVYLAGRRFFGEMIGLSSSLFLLVMPYFLYYSRSGLPEIGFMVFFYAGVFLYLESLRRDSALNWMLPVSGLLLGYSFTCSYKWFLFLPIFLGVEVWFSLKRDTLSLKLRRLSLFLLSLLLPSLLFEALYSLFSWTPTYFEQLLEHGKIVPPSEYFATEDIFICGYYLLKLVGAIGLLFLGVGLVSLFKGRSCEGVLLSVILLTTLLLFGIMNSLRVPRALSGTLPAMALIMGQGLTSLINLPFKNRIWRLSIIVLVLLHFLHSGIVDLDILRFKSGYKEAISYLASQKGLGYITTTNISELYPGPRALYCYTNLSPSLEQALEELRILHKRGFRFFLVDLMDKYQTSIFRKKYLTLPQLLQRNYLPTKVFPNDVQRHWVFLYENGLKTKEVKEFSQDERVGQILIYDLNHLFWNGGYGED
ncbi:TPA: hypothetical protein DCX15_04725 [bacterium]|nr:hypothetical protein [bacterium]